MSEQTLICTFTVNFVHTLNLHLKINTRVSLFLRFKEYIILNVCMKDSFEQFVSYTRLLK